MLEFKFDTQLLIEGEHLDEDAISAYFRKNFQGDCLLAVGDEELIKIHFHTNEHVFYTHLDVYKRQGLHLLCSSPTWQR